MWRCGCGVCVCAMQGAVMSCGSGCQWSAARRVVGDHM